MQPTPWYKNFWPWFLIFFPLAAIIGCISLFITAIGNGPDMVVDDYYKKGKAINIELSKTRLAQKLGMKFAIKLDNNELVIKPTGIEKVFPLLNVNFYHPTLEKNDFYLSLTPDGNGYFRHRFDKTVTGKWQVTITPFEDSWKIQNTIYLPHSGKMKFNP